MLRCCLFVLLVGLGSGVHAQEKPSEYAGAEYRLVGPYAGGRVSKVCGVPGDPMTYYAATASGGVWKSSDGGHAWKPIFDDQPTSSTGSIAVAPSDPNVVYVGTGEANIRGNVAPGAGIFRSVDAGKTWSHVWKQVGQIGAMAVHPQNADIAFAAVLGHAFGPNSERGVYRTLDGGKTWQRVLHVNDQTGCSDVCIDPSNPRVLYAGFWQAQRRPWDMTSGGPGSDLFVSRDGGETWKSLKNDPKNGLPPSIWGKVNVAVSPANGQRIFALIEAEKGGLFRSDDGGEIWRRVSTEPRIRQRAWYFNTITPHPTNPDVLFCPNVPLMKSIDGGRTFTSVSGPHHVDHHDVWIDPRNPNRIIDANDGGVDISTDGGKTWVAPPLPISQFYHVAADNAVPFHVMGCMQDLGSARGPSRSLAGSISLRDWHSVGGGEAGHCVPDPSDPNIIYAGEYGGIMTRYDHRSQQARNITVNQWNPSGIDPAVMPYRFQWTAPILVSVHDPKTVYHAGNVIFRTRDAGITWEKISGDLTRDDKQKQQWSGGPITGDNTGAEVYCTVFALAESPKQKGLLWAGSDDGLVHLSQDDGKTWTNLTKNIQELPDWGTVKCIEPSPFDAKTAYLVVDNHRMDDYRPHVWKTTDLGQTWTKISASLPQDVHTHAIREDGKKQGQLYLGTERGVMVSPDAGKTWRALQLNLPTVPVHDLVVKHDSLVVGTHGRSIWILDDLTPIREWKPEHAQAKVHVYPPVPTLRWRTSGNGPITNHLRNSTAPNPTSGAVLWATFGKDVKQVSIEVLNAQGKVIAQGTGKPEGVIEEKPDDEDEPKRWKFTYKPGLNRLIWNLEHDGAEVIPGAPVDAGNPAQGIPVHPGTYTVKLKADDQTVTVPLEVKADPRPEATPPNQELETLALQVRDDITVLSRTVLRLRAILKQVTLRKELLGKREDAKALLEQTQQLVDKLNAIEQKLHNPKAKISYDIFAARGGAMLYSQLTWMLVWISDADGPPTQAQKELFADLHKQLTTQQAAFDKVVAEDLAKLNATARGLGVPELYVPPVQAVGMK